MAQYVVSGVLETWHDPTKPYFNYPDDKVIGKRRKIASDKVISVTARNAKVAAHLKVVFGHLFKDVKVKKVTDEEATS